MEISLGIDFIELHHTQNRKKSGKIFRELIKGNFINKLFHLNSKDE